MSFKRSNMNNYLRRLLREDIESQQQPNGLGAGMNNDAQMADDAEVGAQQGGDDYEMSQENPDEAMGQDSMQKEDGTMAYSQNQDVDEIVVNIREQCLQGLQMLANDIQDPAYDLLKKMWMMCDKAQTPDENGQQQQA